MERTMPVEERIKRAEEIYNNRRTQNSIRVSTGNSIQDKQYGLLKKIIIQILICLLVYLIFYITKNSNYIFSNSLIEKTKYFLSYDIDFEEIYSNAEKFYKDNIQKFFITNKDFANDVNVNEIENMEKVTNELIENQVSQISEMGIGGGEDKNTEKDIKSESENVEENIELTQMEIDANDIKNNYSLIVPLEGVISSRFGPREPTDIVSANHEGIDIAADEGTVFIASMEGTVTQVSSEGGYGNHFCIQNNDVITLYAHCSNIYVNEGEYITQGQEIGEVGETGNATGPHLHFEIRKEDRVVNPEFILDF